MHCTAIPGHSQLFRLKAGGPGKVCKVMCVTSYICIHTKYRTIRKAELAVYYRATWLCSHQGFKVLYYTSLVALESYLLATHCEQECSETCWSLTCPVSLEVFQSVLCHTMSCNFAYQVLQCFSYMLKSYECMAWGQGYTLFRHTLWVAQLWTLVRYLLLLTIRPR